MPVTRRDPGAHNGMSDIGSVLDGHINTAAFLFDDEDEKLSVPKPTANRPVSSFYAMNTTDGEFPVLIRRNGDAAMAQLTASSDALDLALTQSPDSNAQANGWPSFARPVPSQHAGSLSHTRDHTRSNGDSPLYGLPYPSSSEQATISTSAILNRHSMGAKISYGEPKRSGFIVPPNDLTSGSSQAHPKLQSSYSTNDIPTVKSTESSNGTIIGPQATPGTHATANERFHHHNASLGRIPANVVTLSRHSGALTGGDVKSEEPNNTSQTLRSILQGSATSFGPGQTSSNIPESLAANVMTTSAMPCSNQAYYGGYGMQNGAQINIQHSMQNNMQMVNTAMNNVQLGTQPQWTSPMQMYQQHYSSSYNPYQEYGPGGRLPDSQARVIQQRRTQSGEDGARFTNIALENLQGEIYGLCKDQHGCRYLQKKLEDRKPEQIQIIFTETQEHMVELMTDPFGNYLCQKLLEYTNDDQRTVLINSAAPHMVKIALNQHGTRALQKMIEFVSTPTQIQTVIFALKDSVVPMIQDLNGNHVIQKCLNRLSSEDAQFIFDAVAANCVVVGTHRHGCCVIQRCIDHASGNQKAQLVAAITDCSFPLVQDPFGNYVLQYICEYAQNLCAAQD